ncbi:MAG: hypothetical protein ABH950_08140 [Candidatus Altiarchaeota archaeon]
MSEKSTAVDGLDALKERYTGGTASETVAAKDIGEPRRVFLAPFFWRLLAVLLAVFCGVFLTLSYRESLNIRERETSLRNKEAQIKDYETRIFSLSGEIGNLSAQRERLREEINILGADAAENAENAAKSRLIST